MINFKAHTFTLNYFSQNMIHNALSELPHNSIVITVTHQNFFESLYEQYYLKKYKDITFVYFPNWNNMDYKKYNSTLFTNNPDTSIYSRIQKTKNPTYRAALEIIARNQNRPIYIWQGPSEEAIFTNSPLFGSILTPFGLWWRVGPFEEDLLHKSEKLLDSLQTKNINIDGLSSYQKTSDAQVYAQSFFSTGIALAKQGEYDEASKLINQSLLLYPNADIDHKRTALEEIKILEPNIQKLISLQDEEQLFHLAADYYTINNLPKSILIYKEILSFDASSSEIYSNLGTIYALENDKQDALLYFDKALKIDPTLDLAIKGRESLMRQ